MALREYTGTDGRVWMVWNVSPRFKPARSESDRRTGAKSWKGTDRRVLEERRGVMPPPEWINGWLCFQTTEEKRRLSPVPERWEDCSPEELERFRARAAVIRGS